MSRGSQRKGRAAEIELAGILRAAGINASPGAAVSFGSTPDLIGITDIHCECKRVEKLNIDMAMDQAVRDAERFRDGMPAVFHRRNRKDWLVTMKLTDWLKIYKGAIHESICD